MKHIKGHCRQWIAKQKPIPKKTIIVISAKKISSHPRICLLDLYTDHTRKHASSTVSAKIDLQALAYPSFMEGTEPYLFFLQCLCGLANIIAAFIRIHHHPDENICCGRSFFRRYSPFPFILLYSTVTSV